MQRLRIDVSDDVCLKIFVEVQRPCPVPSQRGNEEVAAAPAIDVIAENGLLHWFGTRRGVCAKHGDDEQNGDPIIHHCSSENGTHVDLCWQTVRLVESLN
jgi:hypothetical protein